MALDVLRVLPSGRKQTLSIALGNQDKTSQVIIPDTPALLFPTLLTW